MLLPKIIFKSVCSGVISLPSGLWNHCVVNFQSWHCDDLAEEQIAPYCCNTLSTGMHSLESRILTIVEPIKILHGDN